MDATLYIEKLKNLEEQKKDVKFLKVQLKRSLIKKKLSLKKNFIKKKYN